MNRKILAAGILTAGLLLGSCSDDDTNEIVDSSITNSNLELSIDGLTNLGDEFVYEGWVIVDGSPVSTGVFTIDDNGAWSVNSFSVEASKLASATKFVLSIEPKVDPDPAPSATKILAADFDGDSATIAASLIPGINPDQDGDFANAEGKYFLRTPTDETEGNNGNDESGIWFGIPVTDAPPSPGFTGMPELEETSGWIYEGWVVVDGSPISTGTFRKFNERDSGNPFSGTQANAGPPVPGEDFFLDLPNGLTELDLRGKTTVISLEPYPDNSTKPFSIKPLLSAIATDAATAPASHTISANLASFPSGTITRK